MSSSSRFLRWSIVFVFAAAPFAFGMDCESDPMPDPEPVWNVAFDASGLGVLSSVWGSGPDDVFIVGGVGGAAGQGEIYHFDGSAWEAMQVPDVNLLIWVFGFGPDDVFAVGVGGGAIHYDGASWQALDSGTTEDLWGVWGTAPDDLWVVGGTVGQGDPVILHYDGQDFMPVQVPQNDRNATSLFKVWGIGSRAIAVGENGLIIEHIGGQWTQVAAGALADDDFVSLWGTSESNIVAVGGRGSARIAYNDGNEWQTYAPAGRPGLNASFMDDAGFAVIGGSNGYVGHFPVGDQEPVDEESPSNDDIHAIWGDGQGLYYAVGGRFSDPYHGLALVRTLDNAQMPPLPAP